MSTDKKKWVDDKLGKMNLNQKVGQLMVFGFCGSTITPDVVELIRKYHIGGLRISQLRRTITLTNDVKPGERMDPSTRMSLHLPSGNNKDYVYADKPVFCGAYDYAKTLNKLRNYALERELNIPIHLTIDQEGNGSDDLLGGQRLFPSPMGLAASGDPDLVYRAALSIGKQARAIGANMIHSPVLDVNNDPGNPEIGARAYSDNCDDVIKYSLQTLKGFQQAGIIATGKHFPGRGQSRSDAHWDLPSVTADMETMNNIHIAPYKALIEAGLPAVMMAHCCYPELGMSYNPASLSSIAIEEILRSQLGFEGVVTTDNMMMGGILKTYEMSEAIVQAIIAGCDLVLCRDESPLRLKIIQKVLDAVEEGRLSERRIDESVQRILKMRWDMGIVPDAGKVDPEQAENSTRDKLVIETAFEAAQKSTIVMRDENKVLPLAKNSKVILAEQIFPTQQEANNNYSHPGLIWEQMCKFSNNISSVEINQIPTKKDHKRVFRRINEADIVIMTNYYHHKADGSATDLIRKVLEIGKPVIVIANTPYKFSAPSDFGTVILNFAPAAKESAQVLAGVVYGSISPMGRLPVELSNKFKSAVVQDSARGQTVFGGIRDD